jgi:transcription elongation factor Elf1
MRLKTIKIPSFHFDNHPKLAAYPKALASDGQIVTSGALDVLLHVAKHPPTFAMIDGKTYLISNLLSWRLIREVLDRNKFVAVICDPSECSQHADVERFAREDDALHTGLVRVLAPADKSEPTKIRKRHLDAGQICPVCADYKSDKVKPLEVPLSTDQNWRAVRARGLGGVVKCHRCEFRLALSHEEYSRFLDYSLPISDIITMRLDGNQPVICPACAARGRRGIVLMRWYEDCIVTRCSHCLYDFEAYSLRAEAA